MTHTPSLAPVRGPRGLYYRITAHARDRWLERFALTAGELLHAVQFSRVIAETSCGRVAMWYEPESALFIATRDAQWPRSFAVVTAIPSWCFDRWLGRNDDGEPVWLRTVYSGLVATWREKAGLFQSRERRAA